MADPTDPTAPAPPARGGLFGLDPDLVMNIGMGLLSAGGRNLAGQGNVGQALQGAMQNYYAGKEAKQKIGMGNMQMQQMQQEAPLRMDWLKAVGNWAHQANNDPKFDQHVQGLFGSSAPGAAPSVMPAGLMNSSPAAAAGVGASPPPGASAAPQASPQGAPPQQTAPQAGPGSTDPFAMMRMGVAGEALGMPGAKGFQDYGKTMLENDPTNATKMAYAKSELAQDEMALRNATTPGAQQAAYIKYLTDSKLLNIGQFNGNITTLGGITPAQLGANTFSPGTGIQTINGQASMIPGMAGALQTKNAAESVGRAAGETIELTDGNGNKYMVPKTAIVGGGGGMRAPSAPGMAPPAAAAPGSPPGQGSPATPPNLAALGPSRSRMLEGNATAALDTNKEFQGQAEGGQQMLAQVQALRSAASQFTPGQFAEKRMTFLNGLNSLGLISKDQAQALGSAQEGQKIAIQLQASATKQLGSREAAQVFSFMGKSLPNLTLSENGLEKVSSWQEGIARYNIARAAQANQAAQTQDATGVNGIRDAWIKNSNPLYFVMASARPDVRRELLDSMGQQKQQFVTQWNQAAKAGYAPRPADYLGQ